jgi:hypothetical protein
LDHLQVVSPKRGGLFRREYFGILFASDLLLAHVESPLELAVDEEISALGILEKDQELTMVQNLPSQRFLDPISFI